MRPCWGDDARRGQAQLDAAGYLTVTTLPDGAVAYQLTPDGARVARQLAISGEDGQDALLAELLDGQARHEEAHPSRDGPRFSPDAWH